MPVKRGRKKRVSVTRDDALPLYYQVYLVLRQQLTEGRFEESQPIPGEEQLRERFGVSRVTIRKTLAKLEDEGLIKRIRGSGTYPTPRAKEGDKRANISGLYENLLTVGKQTKATLLTYHIMPTPLHLQQSDIGLGDTVLLVERVRHFDGEAFCFMRSYIPEPISQQMNKKDIGNDPLLVILDNLGLLPNEAEQTLSAIAASAEIAKTLHVSTGSPLIHMTRLTRDQSGQLIEYFESFYRPDKFEYKMTLSRSPTNEAPRWVPIGS